MSETFSQQELDQLINQLLNDSLTAAEHHRLEEILLSGPAAQRQYLQHIDLHLVLQRLAAVRKEVNPLSDLQQRAQLSRRSARFGGWRPQSILPLAAGCLAVAGIFLFSQFGNQRQLPHPAEAEIADTVPAAPVLESPQLQPVLNPQMNVPPSVKLQSAAGAELVRELLPELGTELKIGHEYALIKGSLGLAFSNGATAILQAPAVFTLHSAEKLELKVGDCSVYAPDSAKGFEVLTPRSRVVDLGTRFSVNVNDSGASDVQVVEGAAEVHLQSAEPQTETLLKGDARRIASSTARLEQIPFNPDLYLRSLPDRVISYEADPAPQGHGVRDLNSVTVQRGGKELTYQVDELIGIEVVHFAASSNPNNAAYDGIALPANVTELLTRDRALNTGLINFDGNRKEPPDSPHMLPDYRDRFGLGIRFLRPVKNEPGPDVVLFEIQSVVYPPEGDHLRVSPLEVEDGLHPVVISKFDITMNSENARQVAPFRVFNFQQAIRSAADFSRFSYTRGGEMPLPFFALAVGIDFSTLGYAEGTEVSGLFLEDANNEPFIVIDPVFIGGFPALK